MNKKKNKQDLIDYAYIALFGPFVIVLAFWLLDGILFDLDGNAWATIVTGTFGSACTLFLGFFSYWQKKQNQGSKEQIAKLEAKILELENKNK